MNASFIPTIVGCFFAIVACVLSPAAMAATPEEIATAIDKGKGYLYSQLNGDGNWEPKPKTGNRDWGGYTAIAIYALLTSGETERDPRIAKAIDFLEKEDMVGTYAVGLRCQVWNLVRMNPAVRVARDRDANLLLKSIGAPSDRNAGLYDYSVTTERMGPRHNSVSMFGVLGMWALDQAGFDVPEKYWELVESAWRKNQSNEGGWSYLPTPSAESPVKASVTAAGVATLLMTQEMLRGAKREPCRGDLKDDSINNGFRYIDKHIKDALVDTYAMFAVKRVGVASGRKYFGSVDWYDLGADQLAKSQSADGSWSDRFDGFVPSTSFALLFLVGGNAPMMFGKIEREGGVRTDWNERPSDAARLASWTGRSLGHRLRWRVASLNESTSSLAEVPVLLVTGSGKISFSKQEKARLREYAEAGGLILGNADCHNEAFSKSFRELGVELFPQYQFQKLAPTHPVFTHERFKASNWKQPPAVEGLSDGNREMMLLLPDVDASLAWQAESKSKEDLFQLGTDIFLYAMEFHHVENNKRPDSASGGVTKAPPSERLPIPDRTAERKAIDLVRAAYGPYPGDVDGLLKLANQFVQQSRLSTEDYATRFALLHEARLIADQTGQFELALKAATVTHELFGVNMVSYELAVLKKAKDLKQPPDRAKSLSAAAASISREAAATTDYVDAVTAADFAETFAIVAKDDLLAKEAHALFAEMLARERDHAAVQPLETVLAKSPGDPNANLQLGKFLCFRKGDWTNGLPHLAKGSDEGLKAAAVKEIGCNGDSGATFDAAAAWWNVADLTVDPNDLPVIRLHARQLYAQAFPNLSGVKKALAERRAKPD